MSQYTVNDSTKFSNSGNAFDVWNSDTITDGRSQLLAWLSSLNPGLRHWEIQERRVNNVGEWLLETEEFRRWYASPEGARRKTAVLFCHGHPGAGKTFISSLVADRLCDQTSGQNTGVSCVYLDFAARKEQSATNVLGSLLKQMVGGMEKIPEEILRAFQQHKTTLGGRRPQLANIVKMLQLITSSRQTFMCIDAIDECSGVQQVRLLDSLKQILMKSPGTRIFATGRPHILAEIEKRLAGHVASVSVSPPEEDVITYLHSRLGEDQTPDAMDGILKAEILKTIPKNISGMFRLVSLTIEAILREWTISRRRERLSKMSDGLGLGDAYGTTIERIMAQDRDKARLVMAALMWISHAERPLRADELCHALAVELGSKDFDAGNVPSISTLVGYSQGLVTVDKETSAVRLIHHTVKEYLSARSDIFNRPHAAMAETCLTYLNSKQVKALPADPSAVPHDKPFLRYCSLYWGVHAKRELSNRARSLALELFQEYDDHTSRKLLLEQVKHPNLWKFRSDFFCDDKFPFNGLHCASFFGIVEVVATLIERESYDVNEGDTRGSTPLAWAARNGHDEVVKMLLGRRGVYPDQSDFSGLTPLAYAAWKGHEEVVKMLLENGEVWLNEQDLSGKTPLSHAAVNGHEGVVKMLLGRREVYPDQSDLSGETPLAYAASCGHVEVVKILLEREEVNPDEPNSWGRTPLSSAAGCGREEVVKILLGREEVDPNKPDDRGQTPLSHAAQMGSEEVVKILLGREEVNPDKDDADGRTPLSYAAQEGNEEVVKMLLRREEVNPDKPDATDRTPLSWAADYAGEGVVKALLTRDVDPHRLDNVGYTPLMVAAAYGRSGVEELLRLHKAVAPSTV